MGTIGYMSPEQALGRKVDHRTDLFSVGVLLYQLTTGRSPFSDSEASGHLDQILHAEPEAIARFNDDAPPELERIILKCLKKEPESRCQSAKELLVDLKNLQSSQNQSGENQSREYGGSDVVTLLYTDIADVNSLKTTLGAQDAAAEIKKLHECIREKLRNIPQANEAETGGDSVLIAFSKPSDAVRFALSLQQESGCKAECRIGINLGEAQGQTDLDVKERYGVHLDACSRLMELAKPKQILLGRSVFDSARQALTSDEYGPLSWSNHGAYILRDIEDPIDVCEVARGEQTLRPPADSSIAQRRVTSDDESTLGWRPAVGVAIPGRPNWKLEKRLGEGGFGEVWLAAHKKTRNKRVIKFCFEADRVRGLRREVILLRLLKDTLGAREDIAQILDWEFDRSPYYLETEYTESGDLLEWSKQKDGIRKVPIETRIEILAQCGVALAAAHSTGVLHKDFKPANILIAEQHGGGGVRASLTDFGIGLITDRRLLSEKGITSTGLTMTSSESGGGVGSGTRLYMAPELIEGKPATTLSDIYALGVVLYQIVIGDFSRAIAPGWERDVEDDLLREDIADCVDGLPERRLASAKDLATRLRNLEQRRARRLADKKAQEEFERAQHLASVARRRRKQFTVYSIAGVVLTIGLAIVAVHESQVARLADDARRVAEYAHYNPQIQAAAGNLDKGNVLLARKTLLATLPKFRNWEWGYLVNKAWPPAIDARAYDVVRRDSETSVSDFWKNGSARVIAEFDHKGLGILGASEFNSAGTEIVSTTPSNGGLFSSWSSQTGESVGEASVLANALARDIAFSHDDLLIAVGHVTGDVSLFDTQNNEILWTHPSPSARPSDSVWFNQDSSRLAVADFDGTIRVRETKSGVISGTFKNHTALVSSLRFYDENKIISASLDGSVWNWNLETGHEVGEARYPPEPPLKGISFQAISPDLKEVATGGFDGSVFVWDLNTGEKRDLFEGSYGVRDLVFSEDGSCLFAVEGIGVRVFDLASGNKMASFNEAPFNIKRNVSISPTGERVLISSVDGTSRIWAPVRLKIGERENLENAHEDVVFQAAFNTSGTRIVTASYDRTAKVWDVASQELISTFSGHKHELLKAEFSPDGKRVLSVSSRGTFCLWEAETGKLIYALDQVSEKFFQAAATERGLRAALMDFATVLSPSLFTHSESRSKFVVYDGQGMTVLDGRNGDVTVNFENQILGWPVIGPDDKHGVTLTDKLKDVYVWDLETGTKITTLVGHTRPFWFADFSPDGSRLITCGMDSFCIVWDPMKSNELFRLEGHEMWVAIARFSPDGKRIATASADGTSKIWDASTGNLLSTFSGHPNWVLNVEFSPDGTRVLTTSIDSVLVWDPDEAVGRELVGLSGESRLLYATWSPVGRSILTCWADGSVGLHDSALWSDLAKLGDSSTDLKERVRLWRER